ncbi:MAG TPA: hypothetical protein VMU20_20905 [Candidatus Dormibacteraeota bacterium]|nr:hypothetical protein [Candidatus Dormibacteraeota bacterium]
MTVTSAPAGTRSRRAATVHLAVPALLIGLSVLLFLPAWRDPSHLVIGGHGDSEQSMWFLRWLPWALTHGHDPLLTDHIGHPTGANLMWNSSQPLTALAAWPLTAAAGPVLAYNAMVTLALALSGWCAYLAIGRIVPGRVGALAGGLLYGFSPYMVAHAAGHLDLVMAPIPPLLLLVLFELLVTRRLSPLPGGAAIGLLATLQLFIAEELLATEAIVAAITLAVLALLHREHRERVREDARRLLLALGAGVAVFTVLADWALVVQFLGSDRLHGTGAASGFGTDLLNLVVPGSAQWLDPHPAQSLFARFAGNGSERTGYLGVPLLALLALTVARHRRETVVRTAALAGGAAVVLSLGTTLHAGGVHTHIPLPALVLTRLPVLDNLLPGRLMLYAFLAAAVLLAVAVRDLRATRPRALAGALLAATVVTLLPRVPFPTAPVSTPTFFTGTAVQRIGEGDVVLVAPFSREAVPTEAMVWQALSGMRFRMPEGYYQGPGPGGTRIYGPPPSATSALMEQIWSQGTAPPLDAALRGRIAAELRAWGVHDVVIGPMAHEEVMAAVMTDLLGRRPQWWAGQVALWTGV